MRAVRIALVGDRSDTVLAHRAIPEALGLAASDGGGEVTWEWLPTRSLTPEACRGLSAFRGLWCVPGSPYESEDGAIEAIRFARETGMPFLGTCGGCQHAILEYARHVLGLREAEHAETHPEAKLPLIAPLACALVEATSPITLAPGSRLREIYGRERIEEGYHCSFGLNPALEHLLSGSALAVTGRDPSGEARALELAAHPFFLLTQFQPERRALAGSVPPVVRAFVAAAGARARGEAG